MRNPLEQNKIPLSHAGFFQTLAIKTKSIYNTNYMMNPEEKKLKDNAKVVPLIALRGLVVFPNTTITVDVGRPKSVRALEEALRRDGKLFFAAQKELINIDPSKEEIFDVGTVCEVLQKIDLPNNNVRLLIKGQYKAKVVEYLKENDYFSVAVEELENKNSDTIVTQALLRQARELLATLCVNVPNKINKELLTKLADTYEPNQYADLICHLIIYQDKLKQKLLEIDDTQVRLEELCKIIASETEIAKVEKKISAQVKQSIDKGQKEYYLKEQMKAISHELGEDADEIAQYEKKIRSAKMPAEVEEKALKELKRLEKMAPHLSRRDCFAQLYRVADRPCMGFSDGGQQGFGTRKKNSRRGPFRSRQDKRAHSRISCGNAAYRHVERSDSLFRRSSGSGQDVDSQIHSKMSRQGFRAHESRRSEGRSGNQRSQTYLYRRYSRKNNLSHEAGRVQKSRSVA